MVISSIDEIKKLVIIALVSDDYLMEQLVLKGGNAIDLVYQISGRASIDLDYSIPTDFGGNSLESIRTKIESNLTSTFKNEGLTVFDYKFTEKPKGIGQIDEMKFWGGYVIEFKLIQNTLFSQYSTKKRILWRRATDVGPGNKKTFKIDIGKFEYCKGKVSTELDGYTLFVYSTEMIVLEKIRAICQQMPEYRKLVNSHPESPRARDFFDIYTITQQFPIDINNKRTQTMLKAIFKAKKVPIGYIYRIDNYRDFHRGDFDSLRDTVKSGVILKNFDFYFDYLLEMLKSAKF